VFQNTGATKRKYSLTISRGWKKKKKYDIATERWQLHFYSINAPATMKKNLLDSKIIP